MKSILIKPSKLRGEITVPPSKSLSHRALICGSLCKQGESIINNLILSEDITATIDGMRKLGAEIKIIGNKAITRRSSTTDLNPLIDCKESGSTLRFLIPISLVLIGSCNFTGSEKLLQRPLKVYYKIFDKQNINYNVSNTNLSVSGNLKADEFNIYGNISSQFISGLLFSLPLLQRDSKIKIMGNFESKEYVNMTIDVMKSFGVYIEQSDDKTFLIRGNQEYTSCIYEIEGDYSQGAFFLVANELGSSVKCLGLKENSIQGDKEILNIINKYHYKNEQIIDASQIPDLVPIIAVLASLKNNVKTIIKNAQRLRIKESDRLKAISTEMNKLGASIKETEDGLIIKGLESLKGGAKVNSWNDHRIAMSLAIAATRCEEPIELENYTAVNKSYPNFWNDYKYLGGEIYELHNRQ